MYKSDLNKSDLNKSDLNKSSLNTEFLGLDKRKFLLGCAALTIIGMILAVIGIKFGGMVTGVELNGSGFQVYAPSLRKTQQKDQEKILEPFDSIEIAMDYADIRIEASDSDQAAISYYADEDMNFKYEIKDRKLTIRQEQPFAIFTNNISWFSFGSSLSGSSKNAATVVYIPQNKQLDSVEIKADSGNVMCRDFQTDHLKIKADYGDVDIQNIQAKALEAALDSGSVNLEQLEGEICGIKSDYGNLVMNGVSLTGDLKLVLESGDVKCQDVSARDFALDSSYGNFGGEKMAFRNVEANMESGDCKLLDVAFDNWTMEAEYGSVQLKPAKPLTEYRYDLKTEYGGITIAGEDMGDSYNSSLFQEKEKGKLIKIDCESGDIKLE